MQMTRPNEKPFTGNTRNYALIALATVLVMAWQFIVPGFYHKFVEDALYTPRYIAQFTEAFRQGIFYPRWMPECFAGYGSPVFVFYSPLLYFFAGLLGLAGLGTAFSVTTLKLLGLFISGVFVFHLLRERHSDRAALIAALIYVLLPTRVFDQYFINTPAGRFAEAWMPMSLFYTGRLVSGPFRQRYLALAAMSYAALILSHITTAYLFTPFLVTYGLFGAGSVDYKKSALRLALVIGGGICLSAVFFVPVLFERQYVQLGLLGNLSFFDDWRKPVFAFIDAPVSPDVRHLWSILRDSILIEAGAGAILFYVLIRHKAFRLDRETRFFAFALIACIFMMSFLSGPLWKYLPGFSLVNFPSRYAVIYTLFLATLSGPAVDAFISWKGRSKAIGAAFLLILLCLCVYDATLIRLSAPPVSEERAVALANEADMVEYLPNWVALPSYLKQKKEDPLFSSTDSFSANAASWGYVDRRFTVDTPDGASIRVRTFYFPGWRALVDGVEARISPEKETGAIVLAIPAGTHSVQLRFMDTPPRVWGKAISLVTLAALLFPYGATRRQRTV